jgi:hypothetical protein
MGQGIISGADYLNLKNPIDAIFLRRTIIKYKNLLSIFRKQVNMGNWARHCGTYISVGFIFTFHFLLWEMT